MKSTNFSSTVDMQLLLDSLCRTFTEFKSHEQIENKLILRKLRSKMRTDRTIYNCHKVSCAIINSGFDMLIATDYPSANFFK